MLCSPPTHEIHYIPSPFLSSQRGNRVVLSRTTFFVTIRLNTDEQQSLPKG